MAIYRGTSEISYVVWGVSSVIYNVSSGNTFVVENIPSAMLEKCFADCCFDEKEINQKLTSVDEQLLSECLNSFVKMDLLEKVEN